MDIPQAGKHAIIIIAVLAILYFFIVFAGIPIPQPILCVIGIVVFALFCIWMINVLSGRGGGPTI